LLRRGNTIQLLNAVGDLPLAIFGDTTYSDETLMLETGDVVLMFTDGIVEGRNGAGEMFGDERLQAALLAAKGDAKAILAAVIHEHCQFLDGTHSRDDATMLVLEVIEGEEGDAQAGFLG
jgi:phosphoserine phosphatase RsbU/P